MENTPRSHGSQYSLPSGFNVGVIPPDGTQLTIDVWLLILGLGLDEKDAFVKQLNKDKIPHPKFCGVMTVDATHIRRVVHCGRGESS